MYKTLILTRNCAKTLRNFSSSTARYQERVDLSKVKEAQKRFQVEDGVPVYLKGGTTDRILFGVTCVITVIGLGLSFETIYSLAVPPKN